MSYTTAAFIRKNTPKLRKNIEEIGYKFAFPHITPSSGCVIVTGTGGFYNVSYNIEHLVCNSYIIDCGENEALFLALAALNDETDYMQWFTDGLHWEQCRDKQADLSTWFNYYRLEPHKATVAELIEHFKEE